MMIKLDAITTPTRSSRRRPGSRARMYEVRGIERSVNRIRIWKDDRERSRKYWIPTFAGMSGIGESGLGREAPHA